MLVNQRELADAFGVTTRTVQRWEADGLADARVGPGATYELAAAIAWRIDSVRQDAEDDYRAARTRLVNAQAVAAERNEALKQGQMIHREDVALLVREPLEEVNRTLKAGPRRHAKKWARVLRIKEAEALELLESFVEDVRGDCRKLADTLGPARAAEK